MRRPHCGRPEPVGSSYLVVVMQDVTTTIAQLPEIDQEFILVDLAISLGRDPHAQGEVWMTLDAEIWRVVEIASARLAFVIDDDAHTVTLASITLAER